MKSNELRISNLVYNKRNKVISVVEVDTTLSSNPKYDNYFSDRISYFDNNDESDLAKITGIVSSFITDFKPIKLTEEWLLKFGFYKDGRSLEHIQVYYIGENPITHDWLFELKNVGTGFFYRNGFFKMEYVHSLQNLYFALTGEELTLK